MNRVSIPGMDEKSLLVRSVHTGSGAYPAPHSVDTRDLSRGNGGKAARAWTGYLA